jgi:Asp-tRNA(Asn)/Glu-tRNA(Gln) amidotransferase C subunit
MSNKPSLTLTKVLSLISKISSEEELKKMSSYLKKILQEQKTLNRVLKRQMVVLMKKKNISHKLIEQITGVDKTNIEKMYKRWKDRP